MSYLKASTVKVKPEAESVICVCCSDMSLCSSDTFLKACQDLAVFPKPETRMSCNQSKTFIFYFITTHCSIRHGHDLFCSYRQWNVSGIIDALKYCWQQRRLKELRIRSTFVRCLLLIGSLVCVIQMTEHQTTNIRVSKSCWQWVQLSMYKCRKDIADRPATVWPLF